MALSVTRKYLLNLRKKIKAGDEPYIREHLHDLYPADIADILNRLNIEEAQYLYSHLGEEEAAKVLVEMEEDAREKFLASLSSQEIAERFIDNMPSDDAADVIAELPDKVQGEVLSHMEDTSQASDIVDLMTYNENTAGGLMAKEMISANIRWNVLECVREMRKQAEEVKTVYAIYVVDDDNRLLGTLSLKKLLTTPLRTRISDVYNREVISVKTNTSSEEVANIMHKYDLVVLPVVDHLGRLAGRITIDDVVNVIRKEQTEDIQKIGGMEAVDKAYMNVPFGEMIRKRSTWLVVLFIGESFTATAMSFFEDQIAKAVVLALFVPLIISSGGNTGSQASSLIIRALALNEVSLAEWWRIVRKEIGVGLMLGLILGVVGFMRVAVWSIFVNVYGPHWLSVAATVSISLVGVVLWGNLVGSLLPVFLKKIGLDPAVSSAPFVATLVDVTGLVIYFTVAALFLRGILL